MENESKMPEGLQRLLRSTDDFRGHLAIDIDQAAKLLKEMAEALQDSLISQDCEWENKNLGHDWADVCVKKREVLKKWWQWK